MLNGFLRCSLSGIEHLRQSVNILRLYALHSIFFMNMAHVGRTGVPMATFTVKVRQSPVTAYPMQPSVCVVLGTCSVDQNGDRRMSTNLATEQEIDAWHNWMKVQLATAAKECRRKLRKANAADRQRLGIEQRDTSGVSDEADVDQPHHP